jgi:hypothetical protein
MIDDADAIEGLALDMLDVADRRGQDAFIRTDDAPFHVGRGHPAVVEGDGDHRDLDFGEDVGGHLEHHHEDAQDRHQQRRHHKRIGPPEREPHNPHNRTSTSMIVSR